MANAKKNKKPASSRRPVSYKDYLTKDGLLKLEAWARDGLTDEQIANNIGIATSTIYVWKNKYIEIAESLKRGKQVVDIEVENALLKNALGYEYEETETFIEKDANGKEVKRVKTFKKHQAPNTTAQIYWLKNRKPFEWRDKQEISIEGNVSIEDKNEQFRKYLTNSKEE